MTVDIKAGVKKVSEWLKLLSYPNEHTIDCFREIYGDDPELLMGRIGWYLDVVRQFGDVYGADRDVFIVRAPARINLIGMHIDHRGGSVNSIASREIIMVVEGREDDQVVLHNTDEEFGPRRFAINEELPEERIADWNGWTKEKAKEREKAGTAGDWSNYIKAPLLYLQDKLRGGCRLKGMNVMVSGNVPRAAGLSSSSALVVCTAEASLSVNGLALAPEELVGLCATAEWYVGTRGGAGDHAAIKFSRRGFLSHVNFFPLKVELVPFPEDYKVVICNTGVEAKKATDARNTFNQRIAAYEIALMLIRRNYPQFAPKLHHLRDVNATNLGVDEATIYEVLLSLPETITRERLAKELPAQRGKLSQLYETHKNPSGGYRVRQVCLYGLAECQRSEIAVERLKRGDVEGFGELMNLSHEGDRVSRLVRGKMVPQDYALTDAKLRDLIEGLRSDDPVRVEACRLYKQPGGYRVSCPEGDELVDIAQEIKGVVGARLIGAGLGGCVAVLIRREGIEELIRAVEARYYRPKGLPPAVEICAPIEGSGILAI